MAYEDFTTYTEVDNENNIDVTSTKITFTDLLSQSTSAVYKSGQSIGTSFKYRVHVVITDYDDDNETGSMVTAFGVSNGDLNSRSATEGMFLQVSGAYMFGYQRLYFAFYDKDGGNSCGNWGVATLPADLYIELERDAANEVYYMRLYSDSDYSVLIWEYSNSLNVVGSGFTHIIGCAGSDGIVDDYVITGYVEHLEEVSASQVETPTADPDSCNFVPPLEVALSCATEGATIYYTTDGTTPDDESAEYSTPLCLIGFTVLKAIAYKDGYTPSEVATFTYVYVSIGVWTPPDVIVHPVTPPGDDVGGDGLVRYDLAVRTKSRTEIVYLPDNAGRLKIADSIIKIDQYIATRLGSLSIVESGGFRIKETPGYNTLEITETDFELTKVGNNLTVKPKSTTQTLKQVWR